MVSGMHYMQIQKQKQLKRILEAVDLSKSAVSRQELVKDCFDKFNLPPSSTNNYINELGKEKLIFIEEDLIWSKALWDEVQKERKAK